jgi:hypothetical protein
MYISQFKNHGAAHLRLVENYKTHVGNKPVRKVNIIYNIGPLHKFDDGQPNYLARLRDSFDKGNPLIE